MRASSFYSRSTANPTDNSVPQKVHKRFLHVSNGSLYKGNYTYSSYAAPISARPSGKNPQYTWVNLVVWLYDKSPTLIDLSRSLKNTHSPTGLNMKRRVRVRWLGVNWVDCYCKSLGSTKIYSGLKVGQTLCISQTTFRIILNWKNNLRWNFTNKTLLYHHWGNIWEAS